MAVGSRKRAKDDFARLSGSRARAILEERTRALASRTSADAAPTAQRLEVMCCVVGQNLYGLALAELTGVQPFEKHSAVISHHPAALGLIVQGGQIRQALDLATLLGGVPANRTGGWLILLTQPLNVALRVEELPVIAAVEPSEDEARGTVLNGGYAGRTVAFLSPHDLIASAQTTISHGADVA